jgi:hypothetical protein
MLQSWAEDDDSEFVDALDNIIAISENEIQRDLNLEIFNTTATGTILAGSAGRLVTKPGDLLVTRSIYYTSAGTITYLLPKTIEYIETYWPNLSQSSAPLHFAEYSTTQWLIGPCADAAYDYTVRYTVRPTGLSNSNQTTWISTYAADPLFKCCMKNAEEYLKEDPSTEAGRIELFKRDYQESIIKFLNEVAPMVQSNYMK